MINKDAIFSHNIFVGRRKSLLEPLSNVGQGDSEGLNGREWVLEIQRVGIMIDAAELHHLE